MPSHQVKPNDAIQVQLIKQFDLLCAQQLDLCQDLEDIADGLGDKPDRLVCLGMASKLVPIMTQVHKFEAQTLFPALAKATRGLDTRRACATNRSLVQLKAEHDDDVCLVGEVVEALLEVGRGKSSVSPDAIGYLLRGLFGGLRRHVAYEQEVMWALIEAK